MTKSWDDIRAETCRLYAEGKSLEHIRAHLRQARKFDASTRAFRLKIKAWKVKRADATSVNDTGEHWHRDPVPTHQLALPGTQDVLHRPISDSEPVLMAISTLNTSHLRTTESYKHSPERAYVRLVRGEADSKVLPHCDFSNYITNVLHVAAKAFRHRGYVDKTLQRPSPEEVMEKILEDVRAKNSIDHRDDFGDTALSIAVKASQPVLVGVLLRHGASLELEDGDGVPPLHNAISSNSPLQISQLLLSSGTGFYATARGLGHFDTAVYLATSHLEQRSKSGEHSCTELLRTISGLVEHGANWNSSDVREAVRAFKRCWIRSSGSFELLESAESLLRSYLALGHDPTEPLAQDETDCDKRSFAHCAFPHSPDERLADYLIRNTAQSHLPSLIFYCLKCDPCPPHGNWDITSVIESMLARLTDDQYATSASALASVALQYMPSPRRIPLVEAIANCRPALAHHLIADDDDTVLRVFLRTDSEDQEDRWALAATILQPQLNEDSPSQLAIMMRKVHAMIIGPASLEEVQDCIIDFTMEFSFLRLGDFSVRHCIRRILHVVTKHAIETIAANFTSSSAKRLHDILWIRKHYGLPAVSLTSDFLCEVIESMDTLDED